MASLRCPCGTTLNNHCLPNEVEGFLLTEDDADIICLQDPKDLYSFMLENTRGLWECHACGRLAFNWPRRDGCKVKWYSPDDGEPGRLMALQHD